MTDLGGSLAVASRGLFATGVSTDLNGASSCCLSLLPSLLAGELGADGVEGSTGDG